VKVNDVYSQLNETRVERILHPTTTAAVEGLVRDARQEGRVLCVCGGAMRWAASNSARAPGFLRTGVLSCYRPVDPATPVPASQRQVSERQWRDLVYLAHSDKARAFQLYADFYHASSGQIYWSDTHQLAAYLDNYHCGLDSRLGHRGTETITEINVPRGVLADFLAEAREDLRRGGESVIYGTIRLVEADSESFLAWAKQSYACVIFNLHVEHTPAGVARAAAAYPQFAEFLRLKLAYDPAGRFQSDWYCHYRSLSAEE
jgi:FAD/FMN-containing dehydrogenase